MAVKQHKFNKDIEKMESTDELHDKRMKIFASAGAVILDVFSLGAVKDEGVRKYQNAIKDAGLHFDEDTEYYLYGMLEDLSELKHWYIQVERDDNNKESLRKVNEIRKRLVGELMDGRLKDKFKPFLKFE